MLVHLTSDDPTLKVISFHFYYFNSSHFLKFQHFAPFLQQTNCSNKIVLILHKILLPVYSFYQLFMLFKYSNVS